MLIKKSTKCVYFVSDFFISSVLCCSPLQRSSPSFASTNFPNDQLWILFFVFSFVFKDLIKSSSIIVPLLQLPAGLERVPLERTGFVSKVWKIHGDADAWHWTQRLFSLHAGRCPTNFISCELEFTITKRNLSVVLIFLWFEGNPIFFFKAKSENY